MRLVLFQKIKQTIHDYIAMYPRAKRYGFKYYWNRDFRGVCKKKEKRIKQKEKYGSFNGNRRSLKTHLFYRDGNVCFWCGNTMTFKTATIDHIIPVSVRRDNRTTNLRLIHDSCRVDRDNAISKGILKQ